MYDLDFRTHALLGNARLLTERPILVDDEVIHVLSAAGWDERGIYEATALIAFFIFSGRMEAAAGLPPGRIPANAPAPRHVADGGVRNAHKLRKHVRAKVSKSAVGLSTGYPILKPVSVTHDEV